MKRKATGKKGIIITIVLLVLVVGYFYYLSGETMVSKYVIESGERNDDGTITLQYYDALTSYSPVCQVTLQEKDGNYNFISISTPAGKSNFVKLSTVFCVG